MQPVERLQPREEQDPRLDQTRTDASPKKDRGVRDFWEHECQLHDLQRQEVQQQRESKEPTPSEEKDPLNGVAIGADGEPIEKQINLREHFAKDHPKPPGGADKRVDVEKICEEMLNLPADLVHFTRFIAKEIFVNIKQDLVKDSNQKLDSTISGYYNAGLDSLEKAVLSLNDDIRKKNAKEASVQFICASVEDSGFMQAKSMFYTAVCCHLLGKRDTAMNWYEKAYQKGYEQCEKFIGQIHEMQKKGQMKYYFLEKLLKGYGLKLVKANPTDFNYPTRFGFVGITGLAAIGASWYYTAQANEAIDKMKAFNNEFMVPLGNMLDSCPTTSRRAATQEYLSIPDKKHHWLSSILPGDFCCENK